MDSDPTPAPAPHAIEINGLTKRFGSLTALDQVAFTIPCGTIAGFVGPNGSGKTTTMRILATLLKHDGGDVRVFGHDPQHPESSKAVRQAIGFMPDYFGLYTDMTPVEYLDFFAAAYRIAPEKRPRLVQDILALVNLDDKRETVIAGLSRGMQQRLSLGRALVHSPRLLLLDEPASGLDPRARIELMELLRELRSMGKTILISSHILSELHSLCDMVVIMEKGRNVYTGRVADASQDLMEGRRVLDLTVEEDPERAAELLRSLAGVSAVATQESHVTLEHTDAVSSATIIATCVKAGVRIVEARRGTANLEEIFMRLTGNKA